MERTENDEISERIVSGKAAISRFGDKNKLQIPREENLAMSSRELYQMKLDVGELHETMRSAEKEKAEAETQLLRAWGKAKALACRIKESNAHTTARKQVLQRMPSVRRGIQVLNGCKHVELMQELNKVKQEVSKLKLEIASAIQAKAKAEEKAEESGSKTRALETQAAKLKKEIDCINEEQVLVEIATLEAEKELRDIESQRMAEVSEYSKKIEAAKDRAQELRKEARRAKELEMKLAMTTADLDVLQNEMTLVRAMERNFRNSDSVNNFNAKKEEQEEESKASLQSLQDELKAVKKELASSKEEGFQFMTSMDVVRKELIQVSNEIEHFKKLQKKADSNVQSLNSKLLKAKSKLESATTVDNRAKAIVENLSAALRQLKADIETAKKEKQMLEEETKSVKLELEKAESGIDSGEERLEAAMKELEAAKASEAVALKRLEAVAERTMRSRGFQQLYGSTITISKAEYEYLSRRGVAAQDVAEKKAAAAMAWTEVVKAEEKEILMKTKVIQREIKELSLKEKEMNKHKESLIAQMAMKEELYEFKPSETKARPRKLAQENGVEALQRRSKIRRSSVSSGARRFARSPSFTMSKRRKVMPKFALFLKNRKIQRKK